MRPHRNRRRRFALAALACLLLVLGARAALPGLAELWINRRPSDLDGYRAPVGDIDMRILRGACELRDVSLAKASGTLPEQVQDVRSMSGYLMKESFDKALDTEGG